jgi:hypothetical protein
VLVVLQVALAVILLTVSSLALQHQRDFTDRPTGHEQVAGVRPRVQRRAIPSADEACAAVLATRDGLAALPGESLAIVSSLPILGDQGPVMLTIDDGGIAR